MRRWLGTFIPLVMLAVLAQLMAPVGASRAVARAMFDPLARVQICSEISSSSRDPSVPATPPHVDCCSFCAIGHGGSVAQDAPVIPVDALRRYRNIAWHPLQEVSSATRAGSNFQARAPPVPL